MIQLAVETNAVHSHEKTFVWADGELFYRHWEPVRPSNKVVFIFHRGHEHSGRMSELVEELGCHDAHIIAWDARGHGRSPGRRGFAPNGFSNLITDMDSFVRGVCAEIAVPISEAVVIAHSVAAVVASCWVHDYNPGIKALVLATPAFKVRLYVPFALPMLKMVNRISPNFKISSYVKGKLLTHDKEKAAEYDNDANICRDISNRVLIEMADAAKRVVADAHTIGTPILMLQASSDWVVDNKVQDAFFKNLASPCKQRHDIHGSFHAVFHETSRLKTIKVIKAFIEDRWASADKIDRNELIRAVNLEQAERLKRPLSILNPKRWFFAVNRMALRFPGSLSRGISISWRHGFDSGSSLDHVYINKSKGFTPIGKLIDRIYLNSIGWRGIRKRSKHMQQALAVAAEMQESENRDLQLVDIASGPGRYVLEFLRNYQGKVEALCRDCAEQGLKEGRILAESEGHNNIQFEQGDAFDADSLAELKGRANVIISSGVYELFDDNALINDSIRGVAAALPENGCFVYTNQTWHPQLEYIARVLKNRDQKPWVMRCRPQAEMDALVAAHGFEKVQTFSDPWGIFTVTVAKKVA